jgi:hypothetical protein
MAWGLIQLSSVIGLSFASLLALLLLIWIVWYHADLRSRFVVYIWGIYEPDKPRPEGTPEGQMTGSIKVEKAGVTEFNTEFDWWSGPGVRFLFLWLPLMSFIGFVFFVFAAVPLFITDPFNNTSFDDIWAYLFECIWLYFIVTAVGMGLRIAELRYRHPYAGFRERYVGYIVLDVLKFALMVTAVGLDAGLSPGVAIINYFSWGLVTIYIVLEGLTFWLFVVWYWRAQREVIETNPNYWIAAQEADFWAAMEILPAGAAPNAPARTKLRIVTKFRWTNTMDMLFLYLKFAGFSLFFLFLYTIFLYLWIMDSVLYSWSSWRFLLAIAFFFTYVVFYSMYIDHIRRFEAADPKILRPLDVPTTPMVTSPATGNLLYVSTNTLPPPLLATLGQAGFQNASLPHMYANGTFNSQQYSYQSLPSPLSTEGAALLSHNNMTSADVALQKSLAQNQLLQQTLKDLNVASTNQPHPHSELNNAAAAPPTGTGITKQQVSASGDKSANSTRNTKGANTSRNNMTGDGDIELQ